MNKEIVELQKGINATCAVIKNSEADKLQNAVFMKSNINDSWLFGTKLGNPIFKERLDTASISGEIGYFVLLNFDSLSIEDQNRYISLIKDREFQGYNLPENIIIVLTIENEEGLKKISPEINHFCVVAM